MFATKVARLVVTGLAVSTMAVTSMGCGNDNNVSTPINTGTLSGSVSFPQGQANELAISVFPVTTFDRLANGTITSTQAYQELQTSANQGNVREQVFNISNLNSVSYQFDNLAAGDYAVVFSPNNAQVVTSGTTGSESGLQSAATRATTGSTINAQLPLNTVPAGSSTVTSSANPPSGNAAQVTFTAVATGATFRATTGNFINIDGYLKREGDDRIFSLLVGGNGTQTFAATASQDSNWGSGTTRTIFTAAPTPTGFNTNIPSNGQFIFSRSVFSRYFYTR